jgi:hypothetical protein
MEYPSETTDAIGCEPVRLDEPYRIIVQNNPVNLVDPVGYSGIDASATVLGRTFSTDENGYSPTTMLGGSVDVTLGQTGDFEIGFGWRHLGVGCQLKKGGTMSGVTIHAGPPSIGFPINISVPDSFTPNTVNPPNSVGGDLPDFNTTGGASD